MSSKNPFRSSPEETAAAAPPSPPLPPLPPRRSSPPPAEPSSAAISQNLPDDDPDDLPPPYTPSANVSMGEETIGLGPRRPFQQAPAAPSSPPTRPAQSRLHPAYVPPPAAPYRPFPNAGGSRLAPWQSPQQYNRQRPFGGGGPIGSLIDIVREIADSVSGANDDRMTAIRQANAGAYTPSYSASSSSYAASYAAPYSNSGYAPPAGPPPPPRPASTPPHSSIPDDGSPTLKPAPGHPLLRDGKLLVYPKNHVCNKCENTGYKNYDPSHPCLKCWDKYGKPYTGALSYTTWSATDNDPRMQRPLPKRTPPQRSGLSAPPPQHPHHSRSVSQPNYPYAASGSGPSYYVRSPFNSDPTPPVPHAIPVNPGDSRLGGQLCTRCGGDGYRIVMLIDVMVCDQCGGAGRVWA